MIEHLSAYSLHEVGQFVINGVRSLDQLNGNSSFERTFKFNQQLIKSITNSDLIHTGITGNFLDIVVPNHKKNNKKVNPAIKIINSDSDCFRIYKEKELNFIAPSAINSILKNPDFIYFDNKTFLPRYENLNEDEKMFASLAWEHNLHETLFHPFIKPAIFLAFNSAKDVFCSANNQPKLIKDKYEKKNKLINRKLLLIKKGEPTYVMVQDFEKVTAIDFENMNQVIKEQMRELNDLIKKAYYKHGFYPIINIINSNSPNLVINKNNELILIDSNFIGRKSNDFAKKDFNNILDALDYFCR